jgi:hypothetical protein
MKKVEDGIRNQDIPTKVADLNGYLLKIKVKFKKMEMLFCCIPGNGKQSCPGSSRYLKAFSPFRHGRFAHSSSASVTRRLVKKCPISFHQISPQMEPK